MPTPQSSRPNNLSLILAIVMFGLAIVITAVGYKVAVDTHKRHAEEQFELIVADVNRLVQDRVNKNIDVLVGVQGLFAASDTVARDEFFSYLRKVDIAKNFPGLNGVSFSQYVLDAEKESFIESVQKDTSLNPEGYPYFTVKPEGTRPEYYVLTYTDPPPTATSSAFGLDYSTNESRYPAIQKARDTGLSIATPPLRLLGVNQQPGFLIFAPIYRNGAPTSNEQERRAAFVGAISGVFATDKIFPQIFADQSLYRNIDLEIYDTEDLLPENKLFDTERGEYKNKELSDVKTVVVGTRIWSLKMQTTQSAILSSSELAIRNIILIAGITFSVLLFGVLYLLLGTQRRAVRIASQMTEELAVKENLLRSVIENLPVALFVKDIRKDFRFQLWNKQSEQIFGLSAKEAIGKNDYDFFPKTEADAFRAADQKVLESGEVLDIPEEPITSKTLGSIFLHTVKVPVFDSVGKALYLLGISENITERKKAQDALRVKTDELTRLNKLMVGRELRMKELKNQLANDSNDSHE